VLAATGKDISFSKTARKLPPHGRSTDQHFSNHWRGVNVLRECEISTKGKMVSEKWCQVYLLPLADAKRKNKSDTFSQCVGQVDGFERCIGAQNQYQHERS